MTIRKIIIAVKGRPDDTCGRFVMRCLLGLRGEGRRVFFIMLCRCERYSNIIVFSEGVVLEIGRGIAVDCDC